MSREKVIVPSSSAEEVIQQLVNYHNREVVEVKNESDQAAGLLERNPQLEGSSDVAYMLGRIAGRREELVGLRAVLTLMAAEVSGQLVVPDTAPVEEQ